MVNDKKDLETEEKIKKTVSDLLFKEGRFNATTQEIADKAGVNRTLINYYFRSRDNLFTLVFQDAMHKEHRLRTRLLFSDLPFKEKVEKHIEYSLQKAIEYPYLQTYLVTRINDTGTYEEYEPNEESRIKFFKEYQEEIKKGTIEDISPVQFLLNLSSLISFPLAVRPLIRMKLNISEEDFDKLISERKEIIIEMLFKKEPMRFKKLSLNVLFLLVSIFAMSQNIEVISLKDAVNYALENKAEAKKAELLIENSEYLIQEARAGALPKINAHGGITYNPILQETAIPSSSFPGGEANPDPFIVLAMGQKWNSVAGVVLDQNLFDQTVFTGLKAAKTTREFYLINAQLTEEQVIERVATAYYNVFVQKEQLNTIEESLLNVEKTRDIIRSLFENGLAREIDLDRVEVQLTNLMSTRQQLVNAVQLQENALKFYMGMPIEQNINLLDEDFQVEELLLAESIDTENRTEFKLLKKQEELLQLQKEAFKAAYYPKLSLSASYSYLGQGERFPIGAGLGKGVYWSDFSAISLNLQIPIFNGFAIKSKVNQADIELRTIEQEIANSKLGLDLEYRNSKSQIENAIIAIDGQRDNVELAEKVVNNTNNNYQLGLATLTDLIEAENALVNAKNNYSSAVLQFKLAEIQLLKSKGELDSLK